MTLEVKASLDNTLSSKDSQNDPALKIIVIQINLSGACRASSRNRGCPLAKGRAHTRQQGALPGFPPTPALLQRPSCPVAATRLEQWQRPRRPRSPAGSARCTRGAGPAHVWRGERAPRARAVTQPPLPHIHPRVRPLHGRSARSSPARPSRCSCSTPRPGSLSAAALAPAPRSRPASVPLGPLPTGGSPDRRGRPRADLHETLAHWPPLTHLTLAPYAHVENCCCRLGLASLPVPASRRWCLSQGKRK